MKVTLKLDRKMRIIGSNQAAMETIFDTHSEAGGEDTAPTPMEILLQAMGACSFMDVVSILRKKRKEIQGLNVYIDGKRADEHPKVFTDVHLIYELISFDTEMNDLVRSVELSQTKYCGASAMFQKAGCKVTWECRILRQIDN